LAGKTAQAGEIRLEFERLRGQKYISSYDWAMLYAGFYDKQKTLGWLEKAFAERNGRLVNIAVHPRFAFLRQEMGFQDLLRRMGLIPSAQSIPAQ
jgi:hypothetical protein